MAKTAKKSGETPLMKQYNQIKSKYPDAILLFRVGDFYETFGEDAVKAARILDIVLTKRSNGAASEMELAGFPHHALDTYLPKLVRAGERVAICDQLEDPKATKKIVKRGVTELVTPGVSYHDQTLESRKNNYLAALCCENKTWGISLVDISTGEFSTAEGDAAYMDKLLQSFKPSEVLVCRSDQKAFIESFGESYYVYRLDDWVSGETYAKESLLNHFETASLKGFGIEGLAHGQRSAGMIIHYLKDTRHSDLGHIQFIKRIDRGSFLWMDRFTIRNLELFETTVPGGTSLLDIIDRTLTPMGARMIRNWLVFPLVDLDQIQARQNVVTALLEHLEIRNDLGRSLKLVGDLERLISKVASGRIQPRELILMKRSLMQVPLIKTKLEQGQSSALDVLLKDLDALPDLVEEIENTISEEAPAVMAKGGYIADGLHTELDDLRQVAFAGREMLDQIQKRESEATGITSLKLAYNNVFGYYIEVRNTHKDKVPETWVRKQTLVNAERYITEELKTYEQKVLGAQERIQVLEEEIYSVFVQKLQAYLDRVKKTAKALARIDCLQGFADLAQRNRYGKPLLTNGTGIQVKEGRHPVIERQLPGGKQYVGNDVSLDREDQQMMIITGPNMSGKSALLRQTALISILAQMGSYVPAESAELGVLDKVFTRVGASDNISQGESTFMVEMNETASILNNLSERSLVLLDEIGRGTSTYDGISIAWAIAEYLHEHPSRPKTLFATHYHELNEMEAAFERIHNFNVSVKEHGKKVIFLRKLKPGGSNHSFGIHVAKMAGMPTWVVDKASRILKRLEAEKPGEKSVENLKDEMQLSFFQLDDPVLERIRDEISSLDINVLTPVEALMKLNEIKKLVGQESEKKSV